MIDYNSLSNLKVVDGMRPAIFELFDSMKNRYHPSNKYPIGLFLLVFPPNDPIYRSVDATNQIARTYKVFDND